MRARSRTLGESSRPKISPLSVEQPIPLRPPISRVDPSWRDSTLTTDSSGSSLYPASSHADSLPTPKSLNNEQVFVHKATEDDVSYRLRLLVNNNYFLPPAHAKPTPADFRPPVSASESSPRQGGFMDLFKSAKRSPGLPPESMNRTNSDSNVPRARAKSVDPTQRRRPGTAPSLPPPRVAVLREQLPDLSQAARQAAKDIRSRPPPPPSQPYQDINPTDTVDVPPPSSDYPFPVQASNLHALTVQEALGADVLAERLPPKSDEPWRRKLLQAAVGHSFSTATSPSPPTSATVSSYGSLVTRHAPGPSAGSIPSSPAPGSTTKMILGQPISIGPPVILASPPPRRASLDAGKHRYMFPQLNSPTTPTAIPPLPQGRTMGSTPLSPPPRKFSQPGPGGVHPLSSISQIELDTAPSVNPSSGPTSSSSPSTPTSSSAPSKPSLHVPDREGLPLSMTPPPSRPNQRESEDSCVTSSSESHRAESVSSASESAYSDEEEHHPRRSLALSALRGRYDHVGQSQVRESGD
ncbi:hypothetical protein DL96DRAFT_456899 [Flagelloscypha sp. PMI_526]|nr:hypothetical protein DL96DRAFT_456899 [Flagelloscypha sp. PMI_526]